MVAWGKRRPEWCKEHRVGELFLVSVVNFCGACIACALLLTWNCRCLIDRALSLRACWEISAPIPAWTPDTVMAGAGRPPTTLLRPTLQVVDGGPSPAMTMKLSASLQPIRLFPTKGFHRDTEKAGPLLVIQALTRQRAIGKMPSTERNVTG